MSAAFERVAAVRRGPRRAAATPRPNFLYILPAALFFGFFALLPLVLVVALSFTTWTGIGDPEPAGMENWSRLFTDDKVLAATRTTLFLTVLSWATQTPLSLLLGVWAAGRQRNRAVLSAVFFLPLLLSSAAIALMFHRFLDPNFGLAADLGPLIGFEDGNIIGTRGGALAAIVFVVGWQFVPFHTLIYQAAARNIPAVLYDAATIDGAGRWQAFRRITLPQLRNTAVTSSTLMIVGSLTFFETILLLTNGGPGIATHVLPFLMYRAGFEGYEFGYAAAIATLLVVVGTTLSLLIVRFSGFAKMRSTLEGL
ncbi:MAG TPA: sugar ABC transporter permease [Phytomonospora sp.]